ncbi:hypothetical protein [Chlamydia vaughanii]|uniref:hypothetical protein n=1 Tax=Chlamydia vaughanii TaxID=3112552 RepID=UPI0032B12F86
MGGGNDNKDGAASAAAGAAATGGKILAGAGSAGGLGGVSMGGHIINMIGNAGQLVNAFLDNARTQRTARHVRDNCCSPFCKNNCPGWANSILDCFCTCIINPDSETSPDPSTEPDSRCNVVPFIREMIRDHGSLVVGEAMNQSSLPLDQMLRDGKNVKQDQGEAFKQLCLRVTKELEEKFSAPLQDELFDVANKPERLPDPESRDVVCTAKAARIKEARVAPMTFIITNPEQPDPRKVQTWRVRKLLKHLQRVKVMDLESQATGYMPKCAIKFICRTINNTLSCLTENAPAFNPPDKNEYAMLTLEFRALVLILFAMLAAGFAPVSSQGELPSPEAQEVLKKLMEKMKPVGEVFVDDDTEVPGTGGWLTPDLQKELLEEVEKTQHVFQRIFW